MPIEAYLPDIVTAAKNVLQRERNPWANVARRMRAHAQWPNRLVGGGCAVNCGRGGFIDEAFIAGPREKNSLMGRWEAKIPDGKGRTTDWIFDVNSCS